MDGDGPRSALWKARLAQARREGRAPYFEAMALHGLVQSHLDEGDEAAGRAALAELGALRGKVAEPGVEAFHHLALAEVARHEQEPERALWVSQQAVRVARNAGRDVLLANALGMLADLCDALERVDDARRARAEAAELYEASGAPAAAASSLLYLAPHVSDEERVPLLERAVALAERSGEPHVRAWALEVLGDALERQGAYLPARRAYERALVVCRAESPRRLSAVLASFALLEAYNCHNDDALRLATEALDVAQTPRDRGLALRARAEALGKLHRHREARGDVLQARREFDAAGQARQAAECDRRASVERLLILSHLFPKWLFEPSDMSRLDAPQKPPHFLRAVLVAGVVCLAFMAGCAWLGEAAAQHLEGGWRRVALILGALPSLLVSGLWLYLLLDLLRARKGARAAAARQR